MASRQEMWREVLAHSSTRSTQPLPIAGFAAAAGELARVRQSVAPATSSTCRRWMSAGSRLKPRAAPAAEPLPQEIPTIGSMREPLVVDYLRLVREPDWRGLRNECVVVGKKLILELQRKGFEPLEVLYPLKTRGKAVLSGKGGSSTSTSTPASSNGNSGMSIGLRAHERAALGVRALIAKHGGAMSRSDEDEKAQRGTTSSSRVERAAEGATSAIKSLSNEEHGGSRVFNPPLRRPRVDNERALRQQFPRAKLIKVEDKPLRRVSHLREFSNELIGRYGLPKPTNLLCPSELPHPRLLLAIEGCRDEGVLGTILRSALAFQWHGVVLLGGCGDAFGPVCLRSSQGALWSLPWMRLKDGYKFEQMAAQLRDERKFALFALHDADAGGHTPLLNARELLRSGAQREKMPAGGAALGEGDEIGEAAEGALESHPPEHEDAEKSSPTTSRGSEGEERTPLPSAVYRLGRKSLDPTRQRGVLLLIRGDDVIRNTKPSKTFTRIATSGLVPSVSVPVSVRASALLYQIRTRLLRSASQTGMVA